MSLSCFFRSWFPFLLLCTYSSSTVQVYAMFCAVFLNLKYVSQLSSTILYNIICQITLKPKQITPMNDTRIPIRLDATQNDIGIYTCQLETLKPK